MFCQIKLLKCRIITCIDRKIKVKYKVVKFNPEKILLMHYSNKS